MTHPEAAPAVLGVLGAEGRVPVWLQLVGYPAESPEAVGQRPRDDFDELFFEGTTATPMRRDPEVVEFLEGERLLQDPAPTPGRDKEIAELVRRFGGHLG